MVFVKENWHIKITQP